MFTSFWFTLNIQQHNCFDKTMSVQPVFLILIMIIFVQKCRKGGYPFGPFDLL